ncbi:MAG: hypothetical protein ABI651_04790 [Verrucomicrobiota bacterium]
MRASDVLFGLSLAFVLLAVGCSKKKVDLSELEKAFKSAEAQLGAQKANDANQPPAQNPQPLLQQAEEAIRQSDYAGALVPLTALRSQPNLTAEQLTAVQDTVAAINKQMAEKADAGDPAAQKAMEEYREARRAMRQRR